MNLFFPVYKRLEDEVINLTDSIFFNDEQLNTYSLIIGDLLIRCVIEIEAISKELYLKLGGVEKPIGSDGKTRDLYFDTDCIKLLVNKWHIDKKKLQITNINMFFSKERSIISPLNKAHKRGTSSSQWQRAYQSFKHYRSKSIKKANLENLINALGALYILNLYYSDESFWFAKPIKDRREFSVDSRIYTPFIFDATKIAFSNQTSVDSVEKKDNPKIDECIFIKKLTDSAFRLSHDEYCKYVSRTMLRLNNCDDFIKCKKLHPEMEKMSIPAFAPLLSGNAKIIFVDEMNQVFKALSSSTEFKEVVLNQNQIYYPTLNIEEYVLSERGKKYIAGLLKSLGVV